MPYSILNDRFVILYNRVVVEVELVKIIRLTDLNKMVPCMFIPNITYSKIIISPVAIHVVKKKIKLIATCINDGARNFF